MEKELKCIDFNNVSDLITYGNDIALEAARLCSELESRAVYVSTDNQTFEMAEDEEHKIDMLNLRLDELIEEGQVNLDAYSHDSEDSDDKSASYSKQQDFLHSVRCEIFKSRLKFLEETKKELEFTKNRFKIMALKCKKS